MTAHQDHNSRNYFRVAWQSGLAAALCLGLPAGLLLWLILLQQVSNSAWIARSVAILQANGLNKILLLSVCSLLWSFLLARISGYRPWWKIGLATGLGILAGWFLPLSNLDAYFREGTPVPIVYAGAMGGIVASTTICVSLAYGLLLRSFKAALTMALSTGLVSVLTFLLTVFIFDRMGIRVGGAVPLAMSKVTVTSLLTSAIVGGMTMGTSFTRFWQTVSLLQSHRSADR